jgi:hypothetical protein
MPNPSQPLAVLIPDEEETPVSDFIFEFEDEYFTEFGNTSNYHTVRKPQSSKSSTPEKILDFTDRAFLKKTTKELVSVISHEWLEELELSIDIIRLDSPSTYIRCQIHRDPFFSSLQSSCGY